MASTSNEEVYARKEVRFINGASFEPTTSVTRLVDCFSRFGQLQFENCPIATLFCQGMFKNFAKY